MLLHLSLFHIFEGGRLLHHSPQHRLSLVSLPILLPEIRSDLLSAAPPSSGQDKGPKSPAHIRNFAWLPFYFHRRTIKSLLNYRRGCRWHFSSRSWTNKTDDRLFDGLGTVLFRGSGDEWMKGWGNRAGRAGLRWGCLRLCMGQEVTVSIIYVNRLSVSSFNRVAPLAQPCSLFIKLFEDFKFLGFNKVSRKVTPKINVCILDDASQGHTLLNKILTTNVNRKNTELINPCTCKVYPLKCARVQRVGKLTYTLVSYFWMWFFVNRPTIF